MRKGETMVYATIEDIRGYLSEDDLASLTDDDVLDGRTVVTDVVDDAIMNTAAEMAAGASVHSKSLTDDALTNINCVLAIEALYLRRNRRDTLKAWEPRIRAVRQQLTEMGGRRTAKTDIRIRLGTGTSVVFQLIGMASLSFGLWLVWPPLGYAGAGLIMMVWAKSIADEVLKLKSKGEGKYKCSGCGLEDVKMICEYCVRAKLEAERVEKC
jgi:hypothetical protein